MRAARYAILLTKVVRTESTTAMHALMLEISCPLPCDVSVPSLNSTICGCCWSDERSGDARGKGGESEQRKRQRRMERSDHRQEKRVREKND